MNNVRSFIALPLLFFLASCTNSDGSVNAGSTIALVLVTAFIIAIGIAASKQQKETEAAVKTENEKYIVDCKEAFSKNGIVSSNFVIRPLNFGLAISDDLQQLAYYNSNRVLKIYNRNDVLNSEYKISYNEYINSKTRTPVVSWNTLGNTKGQIIKNFAFAELLISVKDLQAPLLKLKFYKQEEAEKYDALIKMMISKTAV